MIDGKLLAQMFISGANNLYNKRQTVNELNVFPVPDGDTGTNMSMTVQNMAKSLQEVQTESVTKTADLMSFATLRGARGNSGVILSQFFRGISKSLKGKSSCSAADFAKALKLGSDTAYNAVMNPTEGTILTVARAAAEGALAGGSDIKDVIRAAVTKGNETLEKTPDMLPALKKAGVVDAGGQGWIFVLEGVLEYLETGKITEADISDIKPQNAAAQQHVDAEDIKYMYCTEFIVEKKESGADVVSFRKSIEKRGDCMLVIDDDEIVKVHIHTNNPGYILECAIKMGVLINIKIDNMKHQHQSLIVEQPAEKTEQKPEEPKKEHKAYGFVAVCAGDGISDVFRDLGIDYVIEGGQTMNPSTDDFLNAVNEIDADRIFVFPNNKNIILAANQASELSDKNVTVIPTRAVPECVAAMLKFSENKDAQSNEAAMNKAVSKVKTGQITYAVRDTQIDGKDIKTGDILGLSGSKIVTVGETPDAVLSELAEKITDDDTEFITLYYGEDITAQEAQHAAEMLENQCDEIEVTVKYGGQPLYYYIISAE